MPNRRKPEWEKALQGTNRKDREQPENPGNFTQLFTAPPPPAWLGQPARTAWEQVTDQLIRAERLYVPFLAQIERYCERVDIMAAARQEIASYGHFVMYPNGVRAANPALRVLSEAARECAAFEKSFGLNPLAAVAIPTAPPSLPTDDEFDIV